MQKTAPYLSVIKLKSRDNVPRIIDVSKEADFSKPTVLFLPGLAASDTIEAMKQLTYADWMLGTMDTKKDKFQLLGLEYSFTPEEMLANDIAYFNQQNNGRPSAPKRYQDFVEKYIVPLLGSQEKHWRYDSEEAKKNLRNINLLSFSYGSVAAHFISEALTQSMQQLGYPPEEIKDMKSQVLHVSFGNPGEIKSHPDDFQSYHVVNLSDETLTEDMPELMKRLKSQSRPPHKNEVSLIELSPQHSFICADRPNENVHLNAPDGTFVGKIKRKIDNTSSSRAASSPQQAEIYAPQNAPNETQADTLKTNADYSFSHHDGHGIKNYFMYGLQQDMTDLDKETDSSADRKKAHHGFMMMLLPRTILANGLNNSITNAQSDTFTPLPSAKKLLYQSRAKDLFDLGSEEQLGMFAVPGRLGTAIAYNARVKDILAAAQKNKGSKVDSAAR